MDLANSDTLLSLVPKVGLVLDTVETMPQQESLA